MIIRLLLTLLLAVMVLAAACGGGEASTANAPTLNNQADPAEALASFEAGVALHQEGRLEEAIAAYDEAIRLDPQDAAAYNNRGNAYGDLGQPEKAIQDLDEAIRLDPPACPGLLKSGRHPLRAGPA